MCDIEELLEPLGRTISDVLIPSITGHTCTTSELLLLFKALYMGLFYAY